MKDVRIMFMGTPEFAATVLQGLIDAKYQIVALVSQPDRPVGRKKIIEATPTKKIALANSIPVYQKEKIRIDFDFVKDVNPDLIVTCAYGQFIPKQVLEIPPYGCINVHGSLLPKLRGGAPIHHAIMDGYSETGITIMEMNNKMDAGKIYTQEKVKIEDSDDLDSLSEKLQIIGRDLLLKTLPDYLDGKLQGIPQDENEVTFGYNISKEEERIDWHNKARTVFNHIRALCSKPGAYAMLDNEVVKIYQSEIIEEVSNNQPGKILSCDKGLVVACKQGSIRILSLQVAGKNRMDAKVYLNGRASILKGKSFE